jgi:hypothetical protein
MDDTRGALNPTTPPMTSYLQRNMGEGSSQQRNEMHINNLRKASENINESPGGDRNGGLSFTDSMMMVNDSTPDIVNL